MQTYSESLTTVIKMGCILADSCICKGRGIVDFAGTSEVVDGGSDAITLPSVGCSNLCRNRVRRGMADHGKDSK